MPAILGACSAAECSDSSKQQKAQIAKRWSKDAETKFQIATGSRRAVGCFEELFNFVSSKIVNLQIRDIKNYVATLFAAYFSLITRRSHRTTVLRQEAAA
eukprot:s3099_g7.t1